MWGGVEIQDLFFVGGGKESKMCFYYLFYLQRRKEKRRERKSADWGKNPRYSTPANKSTRMLMAATRISAAMRMMTVNGWLLVFAVSFFFSNWWVLVRSGMGMGMREGGIGRQVGAPLTDPFQILAVRRPHLILEDRQKIRDDIQPLRQQPCALIHLQIAPHGAVDGLKLGFGPHELGGVEHRALEMDVDAQDEELADLHGDLAPGEGDGTGQGDLFGEWGCDRDCCRD